MRITRDDKMVLIPECSSNLFVFDGLNINPNSGIAALEEINRQLNLSTKNIYSIERVYQNTCPL